MTEHFFYIVHHPFKYRKGWIEINNFLLLRDFRSFSRDGGRLAISIYKVKDCQDGISKKHSWTRVPHHYPDLFASIFSITMDWTVRASRLLVLVNTAVKPLHGVGEQILTIIAQSGRSMMLTAAVYSRHHLNGFSVLFSSGEYHLPLKHSVCIPE